MDLSVAIRGKRVEWPSCCVGCCSKKRLRKQKLYFCALDASLTKEERKTIDPAYATVTWEYPICKRCMNPSTSLSGMTKVADMTAAALFCIAVLLVAPGWVDPLFAFTVGGVCAIYGIIRLILLYNLNQYKRRLPRRNEKGRFLDCRMIYNRYGSEIRGFSQFVEMVSKGDIICEFEFANLDFAEEFCQLNPPVNLSGQYLSRHF